MAEQLVLVRGNDFVADVDSLDILANGAGITVERGSWQPQVALDGVTSESFDLIVKGSSHDDLASKLQALETKLKQVGDFFQSAAEPYCVFLRDQATGETGARQAPVTGWSLKPSHSFHSPNYIMEKYRLALDRVGPWEATATTNVTTWTGIPFYGVSSSSYTLGGAAPARIGRITIKGVESKGGPVTELWLGFRSGRFGTLANFVGTWEAESGSLLTPVYMTPALTTDATASPGSGNSKVQVTFTTSNVMEAILWLSAYNVSAANYADQRGVFDILMRAKVEAGTSTTCVARLDSGLAPAGGTFSTDRVGDEVSIASTTWRYYNLGRIQWPPFGRASSALAMMYNAAVQLQVERTAGTGKLDIDHFIPIPVDEGFAHLSSLTTAYSGGTTNNRSEVYIDALGNTKGVNYASNVVGYAVDTSGTRLQDFTMPTAACKLVVAAQMTSLGLTDQLTVELDAFKRYWAMRGSA